MKLFERDAGNKFDDIKSVEFKPILLNDGIEKLLSCQSGLV